MVCLSRNLNHLLKLQLAWAGRQSGDCTTLLLPYGTPLQVDWWINNRALNSTGTLTAITLQPGNNYFFAFWSAEAFPYKAIAVKRTDATGRVHFGDRYGTAYARKQGQAALDKWKQQK